MVRCNFSCCSDEWCMFPRPGDLGYHEAASSYLGSVESNQLSALEYQLKRQKEKIDEMHETLKKLEPYISQQDTPSRGCS